MHQVWPTGLTCAGYRGRRRGDRRATAQCPPSAGLPGDAELCFARPMPVAPPVRPAGCLYDSYSGVEATSSARAHRAGGDDRQFVAVAGRCSGICQHAERREAIRTGCRKSASPAEGNAASNGHVNRTGGASVRGVGVAVGLDHEPVAGRAPNTPEQGGISHSRHPAGMTGGRRCRGRRQHDGADGVEAWNSNDNRILRRRTLCGSSTRIQPVNVAGPSAAMAPDAGVGQARAAVRSAHR